MTDTPKLIETAFQDFLAAFIDEPSPDEVTALRLAYFFGVDAALKLASGEDDEDREQADHVTDSDVAVIEALFEELAAFATAHDEAHAARGLPC